MPRKGSAAGTAGPVKRSASAAEPEDLMSRAKSLLGIDAADWEENFEEVSRKQDNGMRRVKTQFEIESDIAAWRTRTEKGKYQSFSRSQSAFEREQGKENLAKKYDAVLSRIDSGFFRDALRDSNVIRSKEGSLTSVSSFSSVRLEREKTFRKFKDDAQKERATKHGLELLWLDFKLWLAKQRHKRRDPIPVMRNAIRSVEGYQGSAVSTTFRFMRWLFLMNFVTFVLWFLFVSSPEISNDGLGYGTAKDRLAVLGVYDNATAIVDNWFFYGSYPTRAEILADSTRSYRVDVAYVVIVVAMFFMWGFAFVRSIAATLRDQGTTSASKIVAEDSQFPFASILFSSWDHNLSNAKAVARMKEAVATKFKEMIRDAEDTTKHDMREEELSFWETRFPRIAGIASSIAVLVASSYPIVVLIREQQDIDQSTDPGNEDLADFFPFIVAIAIIFIQKLIPPVMKFIISKEGWARQETRDIHLLWRVYFIKIFGVFVVLFPYLPGEWNGDSSQCLETLIGLQFWRLVLADMVVNMFMAWFVSWLFIKLKKQQKEFDVPNNVIEMLYRQALIFVGTPAAPMLPFLGTISFYLIFRVKKYVAVKMNRPPDNPYGASTRMKRFFLIFGFITLCLSAIPGFYFVSSRKPICGPFVGTTGGAIVSSWVEGTPPFDQIFEVISLRLVLWSSIAALLSWLKLVRDSNSGLSGQLAELQSQLDEQRREVRSLLEDRKQASSA